MAFWNSKGKGVFLNLKSTGMGLLMALRGVPEGTDEFESTNELTTLLTRLKKHNYVTR